MRSQCLSFFVHILTKLHRLAALSAAVLSLACGSDSTAPAQASGSEKTAPEQASVFGTYTLKSMRNAAIPFTFTDYDGAGTVNSGSIVIGSGSTFTNTSNWTIAPAGQPATTRIFVCTGTLTQSGTSVSFKENDSSECGGRYSAMVSGTALLVTYDPSTSAVYER